MIVELAMTPPGDLDIEGRQEPQFRQLRLLREEAIEFAQELLRAAAAIAPSAGGVQ